MYSILLASMIVLAPEPGARSKTVTRGHVAASAGCQGFHAVQSAGCTGGNPQGFRATYAAPVVVRSYSAPHCTYAATASYGASYAAFGVHRREKHKERHTARRHKSKHKAHGRANPVQAQAMTAIPRQEMPQSPNTTCPQCPNYVGPKAVKPVQ